VIKISEETQGGKKNLGEQCQKNEGRALIRRIKTEGGGAARIVDQDLKKILGVASLEDEEGKKV